MSACTYCGEPATTRDHVMPKSVAAALSEIPLAVDKTLLVTVPACAECNSIAGAKIFRSVAEKRRYIRKQIERRSAKLLASPDADIGPEYGPGLAALLADLNSKAQRARRRLGWTGAIPKPRPPRCGKCGKPFKRYHPRQRNCDQHNMRRYNG